MLDMPQKTLDLIATIKAAVLFEVELMPPLSHAKNGIAKASSTFPPMRTTAISDFVAQEIASCTRTVWGRFNVSQPETER